jgi:hypothetical protein
MFFCGQCGFHLPPTTARCPRCGMAVDLSANRVGEANPNDRTVLSSSINTKQPTFSGIPVGSSWQQHGPFAPNHRYPDTEGAVYVRHAEREQIRQRPDTPPFMSRQRKRHKGLIVMIIGISLILVSSGIFVAPHILKMLKGPSLKATVGTVATHFTATVDFTASSPVISPTLLVIKNDAVFQDNHSILEPGGQVLVAFNHQKGMKHVTCTIRGLVSRLGSQDGFAPISLFNNGSAFQTNFTVAGNGFDPNTTTFEIPPEQLISGSNLLELQVATNAASVFWLYQLEIDQSV